MAESKEQVTHSDVPPVEDYVAENYEAIVADENSGKSWSDIADMADKNNSPSLAAFARAKASKSKADVTPTGATYEAPTKVVRQEQDPESQKFKDVEFDIQEPAVGAEKLDDEGHVVQPKKASK